MKRLLKRSFVLSATFLASSALQAFSVNPMVAEIDPNAPRPQQVFVLTNPTGKEKPIEVSVAKPRLDESGREVIESGVGEDRFLIIPQQFTLPPNARRSVKVLYVGDPMQEEDTYRILFKELPVALPLDNALPEGESSFSMQIVMQYYTRIWLTPSNLEERLRVSSFEEATIAAPETQRRLDSDEDKVEHPAPQLTALKLVIANDGGRHGYLRYPKIDLVTRDGRTVPLDHKELEGVSGQIVHRQSQKEFLIPWKERFPPLADISEVRLKTVRR